MAPDPTLARCQRTTSGCCPDDENEDSTVAAAAAEEDDGVGGDDDDGEDKVSVADSEYMDLQEDIAKLHANREAFLAQHWGQGRGSSSAARRSKRPGPPRGRRRGPRRPPEPPAEIKLRINQAHELFIKEQYDQALDILFGIVRQNAEIHGAWSLMASIFEDSGDRENEMLARVFAAHLFPRDVSGWIAAADIALADAEPGGGRPGQPADAEGEGLRRMQRLQIARICYSGAITADRDCIAARLGKGNVCLEFGHAGPAAVEYQRVLRRRCYNMEAVRNLAEVSYDTARREDTIRSAIEAYQQAIAHRARRRRAGRRRRVRVGRHQHVLRAARRAGRVRDGGPVAQEPGALAAGPPGRGLLLGTPIWTTTGSGTAAPTGGAGWPASSPAAIPTRATAWACPPI